MNRTLHTTAPLPDLTFRRAAAIALLCAAAVLAPSARAQTTAFSYQGKLEDGGRPATGIYEMTFALHAAAENGTAVASMPAMLTPVTNGLFTVMLDFGGSEFNGSARWLQINMRSNGVPYAAIPLLPRTVLGSAPHATYATKAGSVATGSAVKSLNNLKDDVLLAAGNNITLNANGNTITVAATGGAFSLNGTAAYYSGGYVGIGTSTPAAPLEVVGNWNGEQGALTLSGNRPSLRFTGDATSGNQSWLLHLGNQGGGNLEFYRRIGPAAWAYTMYLETNSDVTFSPTTKLNFGSQVRQMLNLWSTEYGIGVQGGTLYQRSGGGFAWHRGGSHSDAWRDPGAGGRNLMTLDDSFLTVSGTGNEQAYLGGDGAGGDVQIGSFNSAINNVVAYNARNNALMDFVARNITAAGDIHVGSYTADGTPKLIRFGDGDYVHIGENGSDDTMELKATRFNFIGGAVSVPVLTITGADFSERFDIAEDEGAHEPGKVVCIDPAHPGKLLLSRKAYDSTVAGIISGAGGVKPGIFMGQPGTLADGQHPVALSGRVYAFADTAAGPIQPGDLLTTSDTPGHVMKAADRARAPGAVLGKAMTALTEGTGLVLVLVSLQ